MMMYDLKCPEGGLDSLSVQMIKTLSDHHTYIHTWRGECECITDRCSRELTAGRLE